MIPEDLITPREASRLVCAHISTVTRWIHAGKLPAWKRGPARYLVSRADVLGLLSRVAVRPEVRVRREDETDAETEAALEWMRSRGVKV